MSDGDDLLSGSPFLQPTYEDVTTSWDQWVGSLVRRDQLTLGQRHIGLRANANDQMLGDLGVA